MWKLYATLSHSCIKPFISVSLTDSKVGSSCKGQTLCCDNENVSWECCVGKLKLSNVPGISFWLKYSTCALSLVEETGVVEMAAVLDCWPSNHILSQKGTWICRIVCLGKGSQGNKSEAENYKRSSLKKFAAMGISTQDRVITCDVLIYSNFIFQKRLDALTPMFLN